MARRKSFSNQELKVAARKVFLEQGAAVSVTVVAKALGVSAAAIFHRAESKTKLIEWSFSADELSLLNPLRRPPVHGRDALQELVDTLLDLHGPLSLSLAAAMMISALTPRHGIASAVMSRHEDLRIALAEWLLARAGSEALSGKDPRIAADLLLGAIESRLIQAHLGRRATPDAEERAYVTDLVSEVFSGTRRRTVTFALLPTLMSSTESAVRREKGTIGSGR
jgi:AcrR family transcriptional regulator